MTLSLLVVQTEELLVAHHKWQELDFHHNGIDTIVDPTVLQNLSIQFLGLVSEVV